MHAAKSRNPMVLKSVKDTVQHALAPRTASIAIFCESEID